MTNRLLLILYPIFIVCMAELNQDKYPSKLVLFSLNGRKLYIKNLPAKSSVTLYDLQGRLAMTVQADNQGCATLQLPATGLATPYVVRTASINFKIIAK